MLNRKLKSIKNTTMKPKIVELDNGRFAVLVNRFPKRYISLQGSGWDWYAMNETTEAWITGSYETAKDQYDWYVNYKPYRKPKIVKYHE